ncbi:superoxide dismutase [Roseomonas marmotae]|uniref:Superoxide dismutase n=1 Tax=Roseomonas marmotae TaxID=2768161 RepID=A0ABS3K6F7_9PROT|nr:superoxide dismutase [Roseomonas marmotae]MBO1073032.1 superoxide dismutase [Roseomonas marmotae]QTI79321.1 superoxide dismutase [Roseomonas marmotae]
MAPPPTFSPGRRTALAGSALLLAGGLFGAPRRAAAQAQPAAPAADGPHLLPPLPYAVNANEPSIDATTMELHHGKHHAAYVSNLNAALKEHGRLAALPLEELLVNLSEAPESIRTTLRNNAGGHANHAMFWLIMGGKGGAPQGDLAEAINRDLGGLDKMKADFNTAGARVFGSGWVFVTVDRDGKLALTSRPNQDTPLMQGQKVLLGNDVWEHAYYLKYQNRRPEYLAAWWNVLDWPRISDRYAAAKAGTLKI